jgi:hypothetical protein
MKNRNHYYFFTEKSFTNDVFDSDADAITAGTKDKAVIRIMRADDSVDIWPVKEEAK